MTKRKGGSENWLNALRASLQPAKSGGVTTYAAKLMAAPLGGEPTECTITRYCRTFIFRLPGSKLAEPSDVHYVVYLKGGWRATIVSDVPAYFERESTDSLHYSIDVSLRAEVQRTPETAIGHSGQSACPIFLVVEECRAVPPTVCNSGECFTIDQYRDGKAIVEGGRKGEKALLAVRTIDGSWLDLPTDMHVVSRLLAAVKTEQNVTGHIDEVYSCSCCVSDQRQAVYYLTPGTGRATAEVSRSIASADLKRKAERIGSILQAMMTESEPAAWELFDSIVFEDTKEDDYLRLQYLRLWQALEDAGKHLGRPQLFNNDRQAIAGARTPTELKKYRDIIAHWYIGTITHSYLRDLQYTAMALLRNKYRVHGGDQ